MAYSVTIDHSVNIKQYSEFVLHCETVIEIA